MDDTPTTRPPHQPTDPPQPSYPYIRAWGQLMGSSETHTRAQITQARTENAPATAVYRTIEGRWATTGDITRPDTRRDLGLDPLPTRAPTAADLTAHLRNLIDASDHLRDVHGLHEVTLLDAGEGLRLVFTTGHAARLHLDLTGTDPTSLPARQDNASQETHQVPTTRRRPIRPRSGDHDNPPTRPARPPT